MAMVIAFLCEKWVLLTRHLTVCDFIIVIKKNMKTVKATSVLKPCVYFVVIFDQFVPIS